MQEGLQTFEVQDWDSRDPDTIPIQAASPVFSAQEHLREPSTRWMDVPSSLSLVLNLFSMLFLLYTGKFTSIGECHMEPPKSGNLQTDIFRKRSASPWHATVFPRYSKPKLGPPQNIPEKQTSDLVEVKGKRLNSFPVLRHSRKQEGTRTKKYLLSKVYKNYPLHKIRDLFLKSYIDWSMSMVGREASLFLKSSVFL